MRTLQEVIITEIERQSQMSNPDAVCTYGSGDARYLGVDGLLNVEELANAIKASGVLQQCA